MDGHLHILHKTIEVEGTEIFYRVAGNPENPAVLLLHGFPSSSVMFKGLMQSLCDKYYLIAPDYPGFGFSAFPDPESFDYTFANFANCIAAFTDKLQLKHFGIYLHDYGCPIGLRVCLKMPGRITGLIIQNGNAYEEGLGPQWDETRDYWANPTPEKEKKIMAFLSEDGTRDQYLAGLPDEMKERIAPELYTLDWDIMSKPGRVAMQLALNTDYQYNVTMYTEFQRYFKEHQPQAIIIWGRHDPFFEIDEVYCYKRDLPDATVHVLEGGHMALETNFEEVKLLVSAFLEKLHKAL